MFALGELAERVGVRPALVAFGCAGVAALPRHGRACTPVRSLRSRIQLSVIKHNPNSYEATPSSDSGSERRAGGGPRALAADLPAEPANGPPGVTLYVLVFAVHDFAWVEERLISSAQSLSS